MARKGEDVDLPPDLIDAIQLHDLIELTGWTLEYIAEAPAVVIDKLLLVRTAGIRAQNQLAEEA